MSAAVIFCKGYRMQILKSASLVWPVVLALAGFLPQVNAQGILNSAGSFAVLGASTVTSTGATVLNGNLGLYPGTAITGFGPGIVNGTTNIADATAQQAQSDALAAYGILLGETSIQNLTGQDLGGLTLTPGVRNFDSSALLTGTLILDGQGNNAARFDFLIGSTLTTASDSTILLINGAQSENIFWQVGSSATLGSSTTFSGSILADQSITLNAAASLAGRALALNGAVTLNGNVITVYTGVPEPSAAWLLLFSGSVFGVRHWWSVRRRSLGRENVSAANRP